MYDTYQQVDNYKKPRTERCAKSWCLPIVLMHVENQCLAWVETLAQSPACRMDTREMQAIRDAVNEAPQRVPSEIYTFPIPNTLLT